MLRLSPLEEEDGIEEMADAGAGSSPGKALDSDEILTYSYYLEISYKEKRILPEEKKFDPIGGFVTMTGNALSLQPAYKAYQLINMIPGQAKLNQESSTQNE